ncbi:FAD-dependent oxidoreductase [Pantoea ananatis]
MPVACDDQLDLPCEHDWSGVLQLGWDEKSASKIAQMLDMALPAEVAFGVNQDEAAALANVALDCGGIFYPLGGWLAPAELTTALLSHCEQRGLRIHWLHRVTALTQVPQGWQLTFDEKPATQHQAVVLANGHAMTDLPPDRCPAGLPGRRSGQPYPGFTGPVGTENGTLL